MKKVGSIILAFMMLVSFTACSGMGTALGCWCAGNPF